MFGQLPDTLEDVWVEVSRNEMERAQQVIDQVPTIHPFQLKYDRIANVDWESCSEVLDKHLQLDLLTRSW